MKQFVKKIALKQKEIMFLCRSLVRMVELEKIIKSEEW